MTPADPPGGPIDSGPIERITQPMATSTESGPTRGRRETWFADSRGSVLRFLGRWAFVVFIIIVAILGRQVLLPFVFAGLIAYILAPIVEFMSKRQNGSRRMPRGFAIIVCYIVFIAAVVGFMFLLIPRLSRDVARLGKEAPGLYKRINEEYTPQAAHWLEHRFPSLQPAKPVQEDLPIVPDVPVPPGTAFTLTPLPDGRFAMQVAPNGIDIRPDAGGGYHVQAVEAPPEPATLEDKLRTYVHSGLVGLQSKLNDVVIVMQNLITGFVRGIFAFFFTLMIAAFILIDLDKVHGFMRGLFPTNTREDYDVIVAGIDRGLSGVIRGQLVICVINACLTFIGLTIFGVKYQLILSIVAGMMSLIPIFGSIMSSVPIVIVALVSGDAGVDVFRGVVMVLWIVGIHLIEANVLNPKIIGTAAKIHPVFVIFSLFLGEATYGLVGALLAVPLLSAIQVIFMYFYRKRWKEPVAPTPLLITPATPPSGPIAPLGTTKS